MVSDMFEAGFTLGQACDNGKGTCPAGLDVPMCEKALEVMCGKSNVKVGMLMDSCGGHAMPYHFHMDMACERRRNEVTISKSADHDALVGIALDGRGIYGMNERTHSVRPTDLDACGGHVGEVPPLIIDGVVIVGTGAPVYHYHTQETSPHMLGCYGPAATRDECRKLYPMTCGRGFEDIVLANGTVRYDTDCPCSDNYVWNKKPFVVEVAFKLAGTVETFNRGAFISALAKDLNVADTDVTIRSVMSGSVVVLTNVASQNYSQTASAINAAVANPTSQLRTAVGNVTANNMIFIFVTEPPILPDIPEQSVVPSTWPPTDPVTLNNTLGVTKAGAARSSVAVIAILSAIIMMVV